MLVSVTIGIARAEVVPVVTFDQMEVGSSPAGWRLRGTNGYASKMAVSECEVERQKRHCLDLDYNFEADKNPQGLDPGTKTMIAGTWLRLPDNTRRLRLTLSGDGSGHRVVIGVGEPAEWFNFAGPTIDWQGWQIVEVNLSSRYRDCGGQGSDGRIEPPLWFSSLNLEQNPDGPSKGTVRLLSVAAVTAPPSPVDSLAVTLGGTAATGIVSAGSAGQSTLRLSNPAAEAVAGKLSFSIVPFGADPIPHEQPCTVAAGRTVEVPLTGLPDRCGYYEVEVALDSGEVVRQQSLSLVIVPPLPAHRSGRFGLGIIGTGYVPAGAGWARAARALGADWTIINLNSEAIWPGGGAPVPETADALLSEVKSAGLDALASVSELPRLSRAPEALLLQEYPPFMEALVKHYPDQMIGWFAPNVPVSSPVLQPLLAARMAADGRPRLLARMELSSLLDPSADVRPIAVRQVRSLGEDNNFAGLAFFTFGVNATELPEGMNLAGLVEALSVLPPSLPVWYVNCNARGTANPNEQPTQDELLARQARDLTAGFLRWLSVARPQDRLHYQAPTPQGANVGVFREANSPKPSAAAFATITHLLGEATPAQTEVRGDYRLQHFSTPAGDVLAVCPQKRDPDPTTLRLKVTGPAWRIHFLGAEDSLQPGDVAMALGRDPVYVRGQFTVMP